MKSVLQQDIPFNHEIEIVDNGSDIPYQYPGIKTHYFNRNTGVVGGVNRCFEKAQYDWVLFVSNDVRFLNTDAIHRLFKKGHTDSVQAQPMILKTDGSIDSCGMDYVWPGYGIGRRKWKGEKSTIIPNIVFLCHRHLWAGCGKFDENITMGYEDVDFGLRLKGRKIVVKDSVAIHLGNQTLGKTLKRHKEHYRRNRLYVIRKNFKGVDRWLRTTAAGLLDLIVSVLR